MKLRRKFALIVGCLMLTPAFASKPFAVTPSAKPEMNFSGNAAQTSSALASKCMDASWRVVKSSPEEVTCEAPLTAGRSMVTQLLLGNSYSTPPRRFFRFNIVEGNGISRVQSSGWVETQMPFGQVQRVDFDNAEFHNSIMNFLGGSGGKLPIGTTFPNHVVMGVEMDNVPNGKSRALLVKSVTPSLPAERAGILAGDLIVRISGRDFKDDDEYLNAIEKAAKTPTYKVDIVRNTEKLSVTLDREFRPATTETAVANTTLAQSDQPNRPSSVADELSKLLKLKEQGVLTELEFEAQKKRLLSQ